MCRKLFAAGNLLRSKLCLILPLRWMRVLLLLCLSFCLVPAYDVRAGAQQGSQKPGCEGIVAKKLLAPGNADENLLEPNAWQGWQHGFERQGDIFVCDNGDDNLVQRGVFQTVVLNQTKPEPIVAVAVSKAEGVGGSRNSDYSLYLDLLYSDGTPLWGQTDCYNVGTHDWEKAKVVVFPEKPIKQVTFYLLLRRHLGRVLFRGPELRVIRPPAGVCLFDGVPVSPVGSAEEGFQVRDVAADGDFVCIERKAFGLELTYQTQRTGDTAFFDVTLSDATGKDRAVTLVYAIPVPREKLKWLHDPRQSISVEMGREYVVGSGFGVGANGRLSRYPFAAVATDKTGFGIGIDMVWPAFYRVGYNTVTQELFLAYDIGFAPERPTVHLRFCKFDFEPRWQFRAALAEFYKIFPDYFRCRTPQQGLWMPFARISEVKGWQDFGFKFKEGDNETRWDDEHGIITFRYTEPMTWWMPMARELPRTLEASLAEARRLADAKNPQAQALFTSGFYNQSGRFPAQLLDTPWCNGAVWSVNSMPNIEGEITDFKNKWNPRIREQLYGDKRAADLDGEYVDSSEGYVTDELDFRRGHFAAAQTPLTFSLGERKAAIFRGLIAFEYVRGIERGVHSMGKLMMANATPANLCWLAPLLDVMGTETDWNPGGSWRPMSDGELLYRRALCKGKPYCFLMNTQFDEFSRQLVEKYMKRCAAYGMFPGFFSHNASEGHYFSRPELYERDRDLFKKFVPLCKLVAEAGWEPVTRAISSDNKVYVERFGNKYLTIYNSSAERRTTTITIEGDMSKSGKELVQGQTVEWHNKQATFTLDAEDVAVIEFD
jgi:hypothetical protein